MARSRLQSHAGLARQVGHHAIERLGPHERRRMHGARIGRAQDAVVRAVARQHLVVAERPLEEDRAAVGVSIVDVDGGGRHALRAGVETKVDGHGYCGTSQRPVSADLKMASMHAMFFTASSIGEGTSVPSMMAFEKQVALDRVLVAGLEVELRDPAAEEIRAGVDEDPRRPIGRRVERNRHLDAAGGAEDLQLLIEHHLRAAGAGGVSRAVVEEERGQPVGAHVGVALDGAGHPQRLAAEDESRGVDQIAADVHQRAAAELGPVADVRRVAIGVAERARASIAPRRCGRSTPGP